MTDREALTAALAVFFARRDVKEWYTIEDAARERLAQLPDADGKYPPEIVERIAKAAFMVSFHGELDRDYVRRVAVAVLDALNGEVSE